MSTQMAKKVKKHTLWLRKDIPRQNCYAFVTIILRKGKSLGLDKCRHYHTIFVKWMGNLVPLGGFDVG